MTDPNNPTNESGSWGAPPPAGNQPNQGQWNQPPAQGQWNQPAQPGAYPPPAGQYPPAGQPGQPGQLGQFAPPEQFGPPGQYGAPGYPPPPPAKRKTGKILAIVGGALVVVIIAAVVIASLVNKHSDKLAREHSLSVPTKAGDYVLQNTATSQKVSQSILDGLKADDADGVWANPKVGVYGKDANGEPEVILLGLNVADSKGLTREMGTHSISDEAKDVLKGAGLADSKDYDAGTFGGVLKCGSVANGTDQFSSCIWLDHSTMGLVLQISGTPDETSVAAKAIREAGEK